MVLLAPPVAGLTDAYVTNRSLARGGRELNPLAIQGAKAYAIKGGLGVATSWLANEAKKRGQRKSSKAAILLGTLGPGLCALWTISH